MEHTYPAGQFPFCGELGEYVHVYPVGHVVVREVGVGAGVVTGLVGEHVYPEGQVNATGAWFFGVHIYPDGHWKV